MEKVVFVWFLKGTCGNDIHPGPHFFSDQLKIGRKISHTLEELLKMDVDENTKKKLKRAKPGTSVFINNIHANGDLFVKRLSTDKIETLAEFKKAHRKTSRAFSKLQELKFEQDKLSKKLFSKK